MTEAMADPSTADHRWGVSSPEVVTLVEGFLSDAAHRAHDQLGDVLGVAITTSVAGGDPLTAGASTALAAEVDHVQYVIGHGPCLDALRGHGEIYVPDLGGDPRWQPYGQEAAALGARSSVSVPMVDGGPTVLGVVKVYSGRLDGLDERQRRAARELALEMSGGVGLANTLVTTSQELDDRIEAMDTRRTIDLATGVLMGRLGCGAEEAFALLRLESQNHNTKLSEVAADLLARTSDTGNADSDALPRTTLQAPFSRRGDAPARGR